MAALNDDEPPALVSGSRVLSSRTFFQRYPVGTPGAVRTVTLQASRSLQFIQERDCIGLTQKIHALVYLAVSIPIHVDQMACFFQRQKDTWNHDTGGHRKDDESGYFRISTVGGFQHIFNPSLYVSGSLMLTRSLVGQCSNLRKGDNLCSFRCSRRYQHPIRDPQPR